MHSVLSTHSHGNHVAGNEPLVRLRGARRVYAHASAVPILRGPPTAFDALPGSPLGRISHLRQLGGFGGDRARASSL
ncbi:hypothetical protein DFAR_1890009 [Desulfarculales bacterium]